MLFGPFTDGRKNPGKDTRHGFLETKEGYDAASKAYSDTARAGYSIDPNDPDVIKIAQAKGVTPEHYATYAKYYDK